MSPGTGRHLAGRRSSENGSEQRQTWEQESNPCQLHDTHNIFSPHLEIRIYGVGDGRLYSLYGAS